MDIAKQDKSMIAQKDKYLSIDNIISFLQLILFNKNVNIAHYIQNIVMVVKIKITLILSLHALSKLNSTLKCDSNSRFLINFSVIFLLTM